MICFFTVAISSANLTLLAVNIISGEHDNTYTSDAESWSSLDTEGLKASEMPLRAPFEECLIEISHIITYMYKFSIATRNPTPRDRLEKCADVDMSHFEVFDISHVADKFQTIEKSHYLIQRLGKANTRRRQLLRYHEEYHDRIVGQHREADQPKGEISESDANQFDGLNTSEPFTGKSGTAMPVTSHTTRRNYSDSTCRHGTRSKHLPKC